MLRRDAVRQRGGFVHICHGDDRTKIAPAGSGNVASRQFGQHSVHRLGHGLRKIWIIGDQQRLRAFVMFRLAHQIKRQPGRVIVPVSDHQDLGRTRDHVDTYLAEHPPLGRRDKGIARPGDLVDRRYGFGAIGQRSNRLRSANAVNFIYSGQLGRQQNQRIYQPIRRRHRNGQPLNTRHFGRDGIH